MVVVFEERPLIHAPADQQRARQRRGGSTSQPKHQEALYIGYEKQVQSHWKSQLRVSGKRVSHSYKCLASLSESLHDTFSVKPTRTLSTRAGARTHTHTHTHRETQSPIHPPLGEVEMDQCHTNYRQMLSAREVCSSP